MSGPLLEQTLVRGDYETITFTAQMPGEAGGGTTLAGHSIRVSATLDYEEAPLFTKSTTGGAGGGVTIVSAADRTVRVDIQPADTEDLPPEPARLYFDVEITDPSGRPSTSFFEADLEPDIST